MITKKEAKRLRTLITQRVTADITEYLRDQILARQLDKPQGHGRIYRVMHESTKRGPKPGSKRVRRQWANGRR